ncbi:hypothetical protein LTR36_005919 [Oleoguttula mirabilis]|uniref:Methyltransferase n=1 Tax=Oleoguttula mirabilis TaxID=1507867 RepID=A0AAV9JD17_9PEZI|nr:hypothetical protein LTR36_005919 [Oleoguttula mirabilis]
MASLDALEASDPSSVAQQIAAAQSAATVEHDVAQPDPPATPTVTAPSVQVGDFGVLEVDTDPDRDSALGDDDNESFTTSINSTVTDYKFEHGRRYHAYQDGKYALPNDDAEINRLELQHRIWQLSLSGRLNLAPISPTVRNVLDIGCGTGAWVIEFAEAHPDCRVTGADLSPIQPTLVPPNVEFIVDDITSPWIYMQRFDYIHSRAITVGIADWSGLVEQCWKNLEPGGWVEFQEYHMPVTADDGTMANGPAFQLWNDSLKAATTKVGIHLDAILNVPPTLKQRGFVNLGTAGTKWPIGPWPKGKREKKIGELTEKDLSSAIEGSSLRLFTKVLGWSMEEVQKLVKEVERDIAARRMHSYIPIDFLWAQKPYDAVD